MITPTQEDRDAAKALLDLLHIREHQTGSFRSWDEAVQAFAQHAARAAEKMRSEAYRVAANWCVTTEARGVKDAAFSSARIATAIRAIPTTEQVNG